LETGWAGDVSKGTGRIDAVLASQNRPRGAPPQGRLVEAVWCRLAVFFRSRLVGLPSKLAPRLVEIADPNVIRSTLADEVHAVLSELSSEGNLQSFMADLEKVRTGNERGNGFDTEESWPKP